MIYTPSRNPKEALLLICVIAGIGILGGLLISKFFIYFALLFWMQYTAVLVYAQIKKSSKHHVKGFTGWLLNPLARLFLFEFIATVGFLSVLFDYWYQQFHELMAVTALVVWVLFSINFYRHYKEYKKYD